MPHGLGYHNDEGATGVEYAIMASLVAAVIAGVVWVLGVEVLGLFQTVIDAWGIGP